MRKLKNPPPVTTWARGETVPLRWFRNNHEGGFVRWSLVPVALANDQAAHDAAAFAYGCYTVNRYKCTPEEKVQHCGGDNTGSGVRHPGRVPTNVPDGEYVLGWTWYGGYNTPDIEFTDYVDCARVRIAGGVPRTESYTPVMLQGSDKAPNGSCLATRNRRGMCRGDVCDGGRDMKISIMKVRESAGSWLGGGSRKGAAPRSPPLAVGGGGGGGGGAARGRGMPLGLSRGRAAPRARARMAKRRHSVPARTAARPLPCAGSAAVAPQRPTPLAVC